ESAVISSMRGLVVLLICIIVLPILFGMTGIWLAAPVTELLTLFITVTFISKDKQII
ncbi:MAG: MATE family efflux transporter, partial [Clostridia bacterium]|nr:MATE family efflux transporter [Clostridia bacterium]